MYNMKGQGLSITTIVVAAIALLVLVVLVAVFTGQIGKTTQGINSCEGAGGVCEFEKPSGTYATDITKNCGDDTKDVTTGTGEDAKTDKVKKKCYIKIGGN